MSRRVMSMFDEWTPEVEVYSIDEAFLRFTEKEVQRLPTVAAEMRKKIHRWTGVPVSVGMGPTKTLAKAASALSKKSLSGFCMLSDPEQLKDLPVDKVWGVGRKYSQWLLDNGVETAFDLRNADEQWIRQRMSVVGHRMVLELRGIPCIEFEDHPPARKNMAWARSFGRPLEGRDEMAESITYYAERIAAKLRKHHLAAAHMTVFIETNGFKPEERQYRNAASAVFPVHTNFTPELVEQAMKLFGAIYRKGFRYKKSGIVLNGLVPEDEVQGELFDKVDRSRAFKLMAALDGVNSRYGRDSLGFAAGHVKQDWKARFERRTDRYTTRWDELPIVAA